MPASHRIPKDLYDTLLESTARTSASAVAQELRLHHATVAKAIASERAAPSTIARLVELRRSPKVKQAGDFPAPATVAKPPKSRRVSADTWTLDAVREARDQQMIGKFSRAVELAAAMRCDDALFTAIANRSAPQSAIGVELKPASGTRGQAIAKHAAGAVVCPRATLKNIHATLADHGGAIGHVERTTADDGTEVSLRLSEWPLEHVEWDPRLNTLVTRTEDMVRVPIVHGDGEWVVVRKSEREWWRLDAAILPGALVFAAHAFALKGWTGSVDAHGTPRVEGQLPPDTPIRDANGALTKEAAAFLEMLADAMSGEVNAFLSPAGAKTSWITSGSNAWQVFDSLLTNRERAAARIYNGTDGALGAQGGAPGVDIQALFGVSTTIVQSDFEAIEEALFTGLYIPWTALNYGDSRLAPRLRYLVPDSDAEQSRDNKAKDHERFFSALAQYKTHGFRVTQEVINRLAKQYGIEAPVMEATSQPRVSIALAPTDVAKVVKVKEARAAQGLDPFGDDRDELTLLQLETWGAPTEGAAETPPAT